MKTKRNLLIMVVCLCLCVPLAAPATDSPAATAAPDGPRIVKIAADYCGGMALDEAGKLYAWGSDYMRCGVLNLPDDLPPLKDIGMGTNFAVALDTQGKLHAWGSPENGETDFQKDLPPIASISVNASQTIAVSVDGKVFAWGRYNQQGQAGVPKDLGTVQKVSTGAYVAATLDSVGRVRAWSLREALPEQKVRAVDVASSAFTVAYLGADGKIYGDITQLSPGSLFRKQPKIESITKIFGGDTLLAAIDRKGKLAMWGEYAWDTSLRPLWNVPTNLPPITDLAIENGRVVCLGVDGKVYQWGEQSSGLNDELMLPDAINGFLWNPPEFKAYKYPTRKSSSYAGSEQQFIDAINSGAKSITLTKSFTLTQDFEPKDMLLTIRPGVTLGIKCLNFVGGDYIKNQGTIEVFGRMVFRELPSPDAGTIVTQKDGEIEYIADKISLAEIETLLAKDSMFTGVACVGGEGSTVTIDKDYTLPRGRSLWLNMYTALVVPEGVTFTVEGKLDMSVALPPVVKGKLVQK